MGIVLIMLVVGLGLVALPQILVQRILDRHAGERADLPHSGAEFARSALDAMKLQHVKVETTEMGNHYDPDAKAVRLEPRFMTGRSLSAVTVAAHEVGHAMQHAMDLPMFRRRLKVAKQAQMVNWVGQAFLFSAPLLMILGKVKTALVLNVAGFALTALLSFAIQVVTLPVEFDASFRRALPLLEKGRFIPERDMRAARSVLRAAAYTYVAALIRSILTIPGLGRFGRR